MELANRLKDIPSRKEEVATGKAGTVYLCHPFLVHAAQHHYGTSPKFMAQPPLLIKGDFNISEEEAFMPPVKKAIWNALKNTG